MSKILWFQLLWVFFLKFDELYKLILIVVQATDMFGSSKFFCSSVTVNWIFGWYLHQQSKEKSFSWSLLTPVSPPGVPDWLSVQVSVTSTFSGPTLQAPVFDFSLRVTVAPWSPSCPILSLSDGPRPGPRCVGLFESATPPFAWGRSRGRTSHYITRMIIKTALNVTRCVANK